MVYLSITDCDDTAFGVGTLTWQDLVHSWKAGPGRDCGKRTNKNNGITQMHERRKNFRPLCFSYKNFRSALID